MKPSTPPTLTVVERLSEEAMRAAYQRLHTGEEWVDNNRLTPYPGFWGCYFPGAVPLFQRGAETRRSDHRQPILLASQEGDGNAIE